MNKDGSLLGMNARHVLSDSGEAAKFSLLRQFSLRVVKVIDYGRRSR